MNRRTRFAFFASLICCAHTLAAAALGPVESDDELTHRLAAAGLDRLSAVNVEASGVGVILDRLAAEAGLISVADAAVSFPAGDDLWLFPLRHEALPEKDFFLYYAPASGARYLLELGSDALGRHEARLWGRERFGLLLNENGATLIPAGAEVELENTLQVLQDDQLDVVVSAIEVPDAISCIARTLGLTLNTTTLRDLLSSASCSTLNVTALALTGVSCAHAFTPLGAVGCIVGIGKLIACGIVNCSSTPPSACVQSILVGQRMTGSWLSTCSAAHRSGRFAKYYVFTLSTAQRLRIDLESVLTDSYLIVLRGNGPGGSVIAADDDSGFGFNSRIEGTFSAGTYTVEATTFSAGRTGSFAVSVSPR